MKEKRTKPPEPPKGPIKQAKNDIPPPPPRSGSGTVLVWIAVLFAAGFMIFFLDGAMNGKPVELQYSQFQKLLEQSGDQGIKEVEVIQKAEQRAVLKGEVRDKKMLLSVVGDTQEVAGNKFVVNLPFVDSQMLTEWKNHGFTYHFKEEKNYGNLIVYAVPLLLLIFFIVMMRNMQSGQKGMFNFGKSRAKLHTMHKPKINFADVAGVDEAKQELGEVIDFLKAPDKYRKLGGKIPKGVLLLGPPGTGKTLLARAVAGEAGVPFFSMSGSDFVEMFVGVGASRVRDLFETAQRNAPCIVFIDEIDAVGRQRGAGLGGGHDEREQTLNQMLVEMDGFEENSGVIIIAATNRPDVLDPALLRPGRFDRQVVVDAPDVVGRRGILEVHTKKVPLAEDVDLQIIAKGTPGFVGADLANLVNEAALFAARFNQSSVTMLDFEEARDKIIMGVERNSRMLTEKDKRIIAYHEAGHAICNIHCPNANDLHKVTIIPRGRALGITWSFPQEDILHHTRSFVEDQVCIYMGGRTAEKMIFGEVTNGAYGDIKGATELVRKMICQFGMTEELGPVAYGKGDEQVFMGREFGHQRDYSEKTAELIDQMVMQIIVAQEKRAIELLTTYRSELDNLAEALIEHELLDKDEVFKVIVGEKLESAKKSRSTMTAEMAAVIALEELASRSAQEGEPSEGKDAPIQDGDAEQPKDA